MATVTVKVPDGNTCNGCDYLKIETMSSNYAQYDKHVCAIFENEIKNNIKCIGCKVCMQEEKANG